MTFSFSQLQLPQFSFNSKEIGPVTYLPVHVQIHVSCFLWLFYVWESLPSPVCSPVSLAKWHPSQWESLEWDWRMRASRKPVPDLDMLVWPADIGEDRTSAERAPAPPSSQVWHLCSQRKPGGHHSHNLENTAESTSWKGLRGSPEVIQCLTN